jgi:hypothetical protein
MGYTNVALKEKLFGFYPEIMEHGISASLNFVEEKKAYLIKLKKSYHELTSYLDKKDADDCMGGIKCVPLGIKIGEFIKNFQG